jgi:hypothetical protein
MMISATVIPQAIDAVPAPLDLSFSDLAALLPFLFVCLLSVSVTAVWLLAVSRYACKHTAQR